MKEGKPKKEQSGRTVFGPMAMIKIDGARARHLRESQGLTQLYIATAVGVTTDTISRWENGRYSNIKRDNGVRLAEALEVSLEEILLVEKEQAEDGAGEKAGTASSASSSDTDKDAACTQEKTAEESVPAEGDNAEQEGSFRRSYRSETAKSFFSSCFSFIGSVQQKSSRKILLAAAVLLSLFLFSLLFRHEMPQKITALRISPAAALPNQRIPIIIKVDTRQENESVAVILREKIEEGQSRVESKNISPPPAQLPSSSLAEIKWLVQLKGRKSFTYILQTPKKRGEKIAFSGTISSQGESGQEIDGSRTLVIGRYHWADENQDGIIDDREIILVYDRFSKVQGFTEEIDAVEQIWLGSGYRWDKQTEKLTIIPQDKKQGKGGL